MTGGNTFEVDAIIEKKSTVLDDTDVRCLASKGFDGSTPLERL